MKHIILIGLLLLPVAGHATCTSDATSKRLAGAAKNSFMTKCTATVEANCSDQAADKRLFGAAKTSFVNKCVRDNVGNPP